MLIKLLGISTDGTSGQPLPRDMSKLHEPSSKYTVL